MRPEYLVSVRALQPGLHLLSSTSGSRIWGILLFESMPRFQNVNTGLRPELFYSWCDRFTDLDLFSNVLLDAASWYIRSLQRRFAAVESSPLFSLIQIRSTPIKPSWFSAVPSPDLISANEITAQHARRRRCHRLRIRRPVALKTTPHSSHLCWRRRGWFDGCVQTEENAS